MGETRAGEDSWQCLGLHWGGGDPEANPLGLREAVKHTLPLKGNQVNLAKPYSASRPFQPQDSFAKKVKKSFWWQVLL